MHAFSFTSTDVHVLQNKKLSPALHFKEEEGLKLSCIDKKSPNRELGKFAEEDNIRFTKSIFLYLFRSLQSLAPY